MKATTCNLLALGSRIKKAREHIKLSRPAFVEKFGGSIRTLENNEGGKNEPGAGLIASFNSLGINTNWLLTGEGPMMLADTAKTAVTHSSGEMAGYVAVPWFMDVRASAGPGAIVDGESVTSDLVFREEWVRYELRANPQNLRIIRVSGDSMEPTLRSGDMVLVDIRSSLPDREGIYVLRMNGMLMVKRLNSLPGKTISVTSDNPVCPSFEVKLTQLSDGDDFAILGRVIWSGRLV